MWRDLRKRTLESQRKFYRRRKRIGKEPIIASKPLMGKVSMNEKYYMICHSDCIILKRDVKLICNDHNPEDDFWTLRYLFSDRVTYGYMIRVERKFFVFCSYVWRLNMLVLQRNILQNNSKKLLPVIQTNIKFLSFLVDLKV